MTPFGLAFRGMMASRSYSYALFTRGSGSSGRLGFGNTKINLSKTTHQR